MLSDRFDITALELKERLDRGEPIFLLDVREQFEYELCRLPGARLIPLRELPEHISKLDQNRDIVVYCHAGVRSGIAVEWLRQAGFTRVQNLAGGIDAWSVTVDPRVPRY